MKNLYLLMIFFLLISCTNNAGVYWCGDHACISKKEREAYFEKTMIVEIRDLKKENSKKKSVIENITQRAKNEEKRRIKEEKELAKQAKLEEKRRIKEEKELAKQAKLEEKRRIKEEEELEKQINLEEKKRTKEGKKLLKQTKMNKKINNRQKDVSDSINFENSPVVLNEFDKILKKIIRKNTLRPYPDVNDIPN